MTTRARFSQSDIQRAIKACEKAGLCVGRVKFTPEGFEIVAGEPEAGDNANWFAGSPLYRNVA